MDPVLDVYEEHDVPGSGGCGVGRDLEGRYVAVRISAFMGMVSRKQQRGRLPVQWLSVAT
jgi:hypothetical protein